MKSEMRDENRRGVAEIGDALMKSEMRCSSRRCVAETGDRCVNVVGDPLMKSEVRDPLINYEVR